MIFSHKIHHLSIKNSKLNVGKFGLENVAIIKSFLFDLIISMTKVNYLNDNTNDNIYKSEAQ